MSESNGSIFQLLVLIRSSLSDGGMAAQRNRQRSNETAVRPYHQFHKSLNSSFDETELIFFETDSGGERGARRNESASKPTPVEGVRYRIKSQLLIEN